MDTNLIATRDVVKTYEHGAVQALRGVSMKVHRGEMVAIVGPSGSGKSTLLHLLGGLDRVSGGEIVFDGQHLDDDVDLDAFRARKVGFVFQTFHLLPTLTALQNVQIPMFETVGRPSARAARAHTLLQDVGLTHRADHVPSQLSIGERQRVAIARALANDPMAILADEPTGSLDSEAAAGIIAIFRALNKTRGTTIVVVTHEPGVAASADRVLRILDGRIDNSYAH